MQSVQADTAVHDSKSPTVLSPWEDVVRVMTIHKSKGLEFPVVFVMGLEDSFTRRSDSRAAMESEGVTVSYVQFIPKPPVIDGGDPGVFVQGTHTPVTLVEQSGVWIHSAGSAMLQQQNYRLYTCDKWLWMIVDDGSMTFNCKDEEFELGKGECVVVPPSMDGCGLKNAKDARILWLTIDGPLSADFLKQMNALSDVPAKQGTLPSQVLLSRQIVQVLVRHTGSGDASYQLGQLLWGLLAAHSGQSVAMKTGG